MDVHVSTHQSMQKRAVSATRAVTSLAQVNQGTHYEHLTTIICVGARVRACLCIYTQNLGANETRLKVSVNDAGALRRCKALAMHPAAHLYGCVYVCMHAYCMHVCIYLYGCMHACVFVRTPASQGSSKCVRACARKTKPSYTKRPPTSSGPAVKKYCRCTHLKLVTIILGNAETNPFSLQ